MIVVENPVPDVRAKAEEIAQRVLGTDMTNIVMSQWHAESHDEPDVKFIASCAINRRIDPLDKPVMLHVKATDFEHLKVMFHYVEYVA